MKKKQVLNKSTCPSCNKVIDGYLDACPYCNTKVKPTAVTSKTKHILFLSSYKEWLLFIIGGIAGLSLTALIIGVFADLLFPSNKEIITNFLAYAITLGVLFIILKKDSLRLFKSFKPRIRVFVTALIGLAIIFSFDYLYGYILDACGVAITSNDNQSSLDAMILAQPFLSFMFMVIFGPVCEELTYRVGLFSFFRKHKRWIAYLIVVPVFALIHFDFTTKDIVNELLNLPSYLIAGLVLTYVYEKEGPSCSIYTHIANNLIAFLITVLI